MSELCCSGGGSAFAWSSFLVSESGAITHVDTIDGRDITPSSGQNPFRSGVSALSAAGTYEVYASPNGNTTGLNPKYLKNQFAFTKRGKRGPPTNHTKRSTGGRAAAADRLTRGRVCGGTGVTDAAALVLIYRVVMDDRVIGQNETGSVAMPKLRYHLPPTTCPVSSGGQRRLRHV